MKKIASEFSIIEKLKKQFPVIDKSIIAGIGDDAAVLKITSDKYLLATVDAQVEDVHFTRDRMTPQEIGQKAVTAAISDIAAMGGTPIALLISLVIDKKTDALYIDKIYKGIRNVCRKYTITVTGGNISKGQQLIIDVACLGSVKPDELLLRSGAKVGDVVLLTGKLGDKPVARIREGQVIAATKKATAMIDISDGLSTDLLHLCDASRVGVQIYEEQLTLALHGGEEYELCFTAESKDAETIRNVVKEQTGTMVTIIGEIIERRQGRWLIDNNGNKTRLEAKGWDHFK